MHLFYFQHGTWSIEDGLPAIEEAKRLKHPRTTPIIIES
jgi:hypothetical protein